MSDSSETSAPDDTDADADDQTEPYGEQPGESFRATEADCRNEDCPGTLWYHETDLVCDTCNELVDMDRQRRSVSLESPWDHYRDNRPTYRNSDKPILPGGFADAYEWGGDTTSDTPDTISPEKFYQG